MFQFPIYYHISNSYFTNNIPKRFSVENSFNPTKASSALLMNIHRECLMLKCKLVHITQMEYYEICNKIIKAMALQNQL